MRGLLSGLALCCGAVAVLALFGSPRPTRVELGEDTVLDKALFAGDALRMCCSMTPWPCCQTVSCCDAWQDNKLGEPEEGGGGGGEAAEAAAVQILAQVPALQRSGPRAVWPAARWRGGQPVFAVQEVPVVYQQ